MARIAARTVPIPTSTTSKLLVGGSCIIVGWSFLETTSAATAEVALYDGSSNGGALITDITLSSGQSTRDLIGMDGLECQTSLWMQVVSGSVRGAVWVIPGEMLGAYQIGQGMREVWRGGE